MRKITFMVLLLAAVAALGCGVGSGSGSGSGAGSGSGSGAGSGDAAKVAKVGEPTRDGKFEFTVQTVKCAVKKVGTNVLGKAAQGQFCLVTLKVTNIGKEAQSFSDSSQKAYAADGTEYSSDSSAGFYANEDGAALFDEINPGNGITAVIVFDIPATASLARLELHDSALSGGVTVQLS